MTPVAQLATSAAAVVSAATASATSEAVARAWPHCQVAQQLHLAQTQAEQVSTRMNQATWRPEILPGRPRLEATLELLLLVMEAAPLQIQMAL